MSIQHTHHLASALAGAQIVGYSGRGLRARPIYGIGEATRNAVLNMIATIEEAHADLRATDSNHPAVDRLAQHLYNGSES